MRAPPTALPGDGMCIAQLCLAQLALSVDVAGAVSDAVASVSTARRQMMSFVTSLMTQVGERYARVVARALPQHHVYPDGLVPLLPQEIGAQRTVYAATHGDGNAAHGITP